MEQINGIHTSKSKVWDTAIENDIGENIPKKILPYKSPECNIIFLLFKHKTLYLPLTIIVIPYPL
jgi:hypothetical protein